MNLRVNSMGLRKKMYVEEKIADKKDKQTMI